MNTLQIGPARPEDSPQIGNILSGWIDETPWMPRVHSHAEDQEHAAAMVARGWVEVARWPEGEVVGFLARDGVEVHALYLARHARRQGVGTALLARAKAGRALLNLWTFQANWAAQKFYLRHGFCEAERTDGADNDEGLPDIRFEWTHARE